MRLLQGHHSAWESLEGPTAVSVGVFDGVHLGHRATLRRLTELAGGRPTVVVTFEPHPAVVLAPDHAPKMLTTIEQRAALLAAEGIGTVAVLDFALDLSRMPADAFVEEVLVGALGAGLVVVGEDFRFGANKAGDVALLERMAEAGGFRVEKVGLAGGDAAHSSTAVRRALALGDLDGAERILGRRFSLAGSVVGGAGRGAKIGVPTANLGLEPSQFVPAGGVYAVRMLLDGESFDGVCNVGQRPTFGGEEDVVEVHVLDFDRQIRGAAVEVEFVRWIRDEQRFDGVDALVAQIRRDIESARAIHAATP